VIVSNGACIGCGACKAFAPDVYEIGLNKYGEIQAKTRQGVREPEEFVRICPFTSDGPNEDELGSSRFSTATNKHTGLGRFLGCYAGSVSEGEFQKLGSSGGMGTWVVSRLLEEGLVDGVVHVRETTDNPGEMKFAYAISRTLEEVISGAKSRYYPIEMSGVLKEIMVNPGRYALVGVPCFIKAAQRLALEKPEIAERVKYFVALFCGHLKSTAYADAIAWESGIHPENLASIDFRRKIPNQPASRYGVKIVAKNGEQCIRPMKGLVTQDWGIGLFKYSACDLCDDVTGELADISIGDAWLPKYVGDSRGTNVVVIRNQLLLELIEDGIRTRRLDLEPISDSDVAQSQAGGLRHRRDGLAYRLKRREDEGKWVPTKRVIPSDCHLNEQQKRIFDLRSQIVEECRDVFWEAKKSNDFQILTRWLGPISRNYRDAYKIPITRRIISRCKFVYKRILGCRKTPFLKTPPLPNKKS